MAKNKAGKKARAVKKVSAAKQDRTNKSRTLEKRVQQTGMTTRLRGHVGATNRKNQAKRDEKNS